MTNTDPELRILLIEDDEDDYLITRDLLDEASPVAVRVEWQATAEKGLEALLRDQCAVYSPDRAG